MPKKTNQGSLASKLGKSGRKAFDAHKTDDTNFGAGGDLPAGIEGGIARLVDCKFDKYKRGENEGEFFFYAAGVIVEPKEHSGVRIEGLRTSIMEPLCDTPRRSRPDVETHIEWILNEFRKLGVDTGDVGFDDFEDVAEVLKDQQPHFRFRTWIGEATSQFPNPRTNHVWSGSCEYDGEADEDVEDETDDDEEDDDDLPFEPLDGEGGEEEEEEVADNLDTLATAADGDDEKAQLALASQASKAGVDEDDVNGAESWSEVAELIRGVSSVEYKIRSDSDSDEGKEDDEDDEDWIPEKGEVYFFKPPRARKSVECEVTAVFAGRKTSNLKSLDDGKSYKAISWDKLEQE